MYSLDESRILSNLYHGEFDQPPPKVNSLRQVAIFRYSHGDRVLWQGDKAHDLRMGWLLTPKPLVPYEPEKLTRATLDTLRWAIKEQVAEVVQAPSGHYHCWHICVCPECAPGGYGGRLFDHSQGAASELREHPMNDLYTFPAPKEAK